MLFGVRLYQRLSTETISLQLSDRRMGLHMYRVVSSVEIHFLSHLVLQRFLAWPPFHLGVILFFDKGLLAMGNVSQYMCVCVCVWVYTCTCVCVCVCVSIYCRGLLDTCKMYISFSSGYWDEPERAPH